MEKGPQYISSIWIAAHNISVQYGKMSTIYKFNMEQGPQYISSIQKMVYNTLVNTESVHNKLVQYGKCPQYISSKKCPQCQFNTEKGPQYISSIWKVSTI